MIDGIGLWKDVKCGSSFMAEWTAGNEDGGVIRVISISSWSLFQTRGKEVFTSDTSASAELDGIVHHWPICDLDKTFRKVIWLGREGVQRYPGST